MKKRLKKSVTRTIVKLQRGDLMKFYTPTTCQMRHTHYNGKQTNEQKQQRKSETLTLKISLYLEGAIIFFHDRYTVGFRQIENFIVWPQHYYLFNGNPC
jgi:hypothetical protein